MPDRYIKAGDTLPALTADLTVDAVAFDLTDATLIQLVVRRAGSPGVYDFTTEAVTFTMDVDGDPTLGQVAMNWAAGDTDLPCDYPKTKYFYYVKVTLSSGAIRTFPGEGYSYFYLSPRLVA